MKEDTQLQFNVDLNTFSGPLDILLDLAKSQKVNLENISITKLADQFHDFITKSLDTGFLSFTYSKICFISFPAYSSGSCEKV